MYNQYSIVPVLVKLGIKLNNFFLLCKSIFSKVFPFCWTKSRVIEAFSYLNFSNVLYQNLFFGVGDGRSIDFLGGAGADIFIRSRGKMAPQHWYA